MKKFLTLSNILKACAFVLGFVAFFIMFADQAYIEVLGNKGYVHFDEAFFDNGGNAIGFVGYLLVLLASLAVCGFIFLKLDDKVKKIINFALAFVLLLGAIFIFVEAAALNGTNNTEAFHLAAGPVFAGIFGILAAAAVVVSEFVGKK